MINILSVVLFFIGCIMIVGGLITLFFVWKMKRESDNSQYNRP